MNIFIISIIGASTVAVIASFSFFVLPDNHSNCVFCPSQHEKIQTPRGLALSDDDKQAIINEALNVTGIKAWSDQWQFANMDFSGQNENGTTHWSYAIVMLKLPLDAKSPYPCDIGWFARVQINLDTRQVVNAWYPTPTDHQCHGLTLGRSAEGNQ